MSLKQMFMNRRKRRLASAVVAVAAGCSGASLSHASPLVTISILGKDISAGETIFHRDTFWSIAPGDTIVYTILAFLAPTGTVNTSGGGHTLTAKINNTD